MMTRSVLLGWIGVIVALFSLEFTRELYLMGMFRSAIVLAFMGGVNAMSAAMSFANDLDAKDRAKR